MRTWICRFTRLIVFMNTSCWLLTAMADLTKPSSHDRTSKLKSFSYQPITAQNNKPSVNSDISSSPYETTHSKTDFNHLKPYFKHKSRALEIDPVEEWLAEQQNQVVYDPSSKLMKEHAAPKNEHNTQSTTQLDNWNVENAESESYNTFQENDEACTKLTGEPCSADADCNAQVCKPFIFTCVNYECTYYGTEDDYGGIWRDGPSSMDYAAPSGVDPINEQHNPSTSDHQPLSSLSFSYYPPESLQNTDYMYDFNGDGLPAGTMLLKKRKRFISKHKQTKREKSRKEK